MQSNPSKLKHRAIKWQASGYSCCGKDGETGRYIRNDPISSLLGTRNSLESHCEWQWYAEVLERPTSSYDLA